MRFRTNTREFMGIMVTATTAASALLFCGCAPRADYALATRAYPVERATGATMQIQAQPLAYTIRIENLTTSSFKGASIWVNQRFTALLPDIAAGASFEVPLISLRDQFGETPYPGGAFRLHAPTPIVLVEIETSPNDPLVGLVIVTPPTEEK